MTKRTIRKVSNRFGFALKSTIAMMAKIIIFLFLATLSHTVHAEIVDIDAVRVSPFSPRAVPQNSPCL